MNFETPDNDVERLFSPEAVGESHSTWLLGAASRFPVIGAGVSILGLPEAPSTGYFRRMDDAAIPSPEFFQM